MPPRLRFTSKSCFKPCQKDHFFRLTSPIMPTLRKLRSREILSSTEDAFIDDAEFGTPSDDPFPKAEAKKVRGLKKRWKKQDFIGIDSEYICDYDLPKQGLPVETKLFLLNVLAANGGLEAISKRSRLLRSLCDDHPHELGAPGSMKRKRVKWLADRWKRDTDFAKTRQDVMAAAAVSVAVADLPYSSFSPQPTKTKKPTTRPATTKPEIQSPPTIKRTAAVIPQEMVLSSPLRVFKAGGGKKKSGALKGEFMAVASISRDPSGFPLSSHSLSLPCSARGVLCG